VCFVFVAAPGAVPRLTTKRKESLFEGVWRGAARGGKGKLHCLHSRDAAVRDLDVGEALRLRLVDAVEEPERVDAVGEGRAALKEAALHRLLDVGELLAGGGGPDGHGCGGAAGAGGGGGARAGAPPRGGGGGTAAPEGGAEGGGDGSHGCGCEWGVVWVWCVCAHEE
jgi:hypothetical protein